MKNEETQNAAFIRVRLDLQFRDGFFFDGIGGLYSRQSFIISRNLTIPKAYDRESIYSGIAKSG